MLWQLLCWGRRKMAMMRRTKIARVQSQNNAWCSQLLPCDFAIHEDYYDRSYCRGRFPSDASLWTWDLENSGTRTRVLWCTKRASSSMERTIIFCGTAVLYTFVTGGLGLKSLVMRHSFMFRFDPKDDSKSNSITQTQVLSFLVWTPWLGNEPKPHAIPLRICWSGSDLETFLINVYDHTKRRAVTFETYGLESQDQLGEPSHTSSKFLW